MPSQMISIPVQIMKFIGEPQRGVVECRLVDVDGTVHVFVEKAEVVSVEPLSAESYFPRAGVMACDVDADFKDGQGRKLSRVTTERPWHIKSVEGKSVFEVLSSQVLRL